ncbi:MAG: thiamine-phosphate kinase [Verrucomicrobiota bacterium]
MTEELFIQSLTKGWKPRDPELVGVGDDCAVVRKAPDGSSLLLKTDAVVEGVHFLRTADPVLIGRKALARAVSDIAAMGGTPLYALVTLGLPSGFQPVRIQKIYKGITALAGDWNIELLGGETTRTRELLLSISLFGETKGYAPVLRSTAKEEDEIWVTGLLGNTLKQKHLTFEPRVLEGKWLAEKGIASSMMDLSDGLGADLPKLAHASDLSFDLDLEAIPRAKGADIKQAFQEGEDYELLFTVPPSQVAKLKKFTLKTPLQKIGVMKKKTFVIPEPVRTLLHGYDHLQKR